MNDSIFVWELENGQRQEALVEGLKTAVKLHYEEYTDQESLYEPFADALQTVLQHTYSCENLEELVSEAEYEINRNGGVYSDSDGSRHKVITYPEAYAEVVDR